MQHPAYGADGGTPSRSSLPTSAGAPLGTLGAKAASLFHAARRCGNKHGAAPFSASDLNPFLSKNEATRVSTCSSVRSSEFSQIGCNLPCLRQVGGAPVER